MRSRRLAALLLFTACSSEPAVVPIVLESGAHRLELAPDGARFVLSRAGQVLLSFEQDAFELGVVRALDDGASYDPYWLVHRDALFEPDPPEDLRWLKVKSTTVRTHGATSAVIALAFEAGQAGRVELAAGREDALVLRFVPEVSGEAVAYLRVRPSVAEEERFYGLGEWPDAVEHRGRVRPMQLEPDLGLESASNENHVPVPLLIGTSGWGVFVKSRRVGLFDVAAARPDKVEITYGTAEHSDQGLEVHLFGAAHPLDVTRHYYRLTGDPLLPAPWALGPWIWRDENRDQAEVEADIETLRRLDLATSAIWIDRPYATKVNTFDFEPGAYPDPRAMIERAHASGLRVALWHTPYLEEGAEPFRSEALEKRFFPPKTGSLLNGWSAPIDLTNPAAYAFWQENLRRYTELGIEGFKLDYAEDVIPGLAGGRNQWRFFDGSDERTGHHDYTLLYHRVYAEILPQTGGFLLCRAARWGDQTRVSVIWPGDMDANFARHREEFTDRDGETVTGVGGLPATVIQGLSLGPSGFPFFGADTGGYRHSPPDRETYIRWFQQTALSTVMQVGDSSSQPPWVFTAENGRDDATLDLYRTHARLHQRLFPYLWTYAQRLSEDGRPIQRALGLAHPELGEHPGDLYLLGDALLVAPVVERGAREKRVIFPAGDWVDVDTGEIFTGPDVQTVAAPLEKLPLFLKRGGIVPLLRPTIDTVSPASDPEVDSFANRAGPLYLWLADRGEGSFTLYDGTRVEQTAERIAITRGTVFGADPIWLQLIARPSPPASVEAGSMRLERAADLAALEAAGEGWSFEPGRAGGTLWIVLAPGKSELVLR